MFGYLGEANRNSLTLWLYLGGFSWSHSFRFNQVINIYIDTQILRLISKYLSTYMNIYVGAYVRLFLFDKNPELFGSGPFVLFQQ